MQKRELCRLRYPGPQINNRRERIRRELLERSPHLSGDAITRIFHKDLEILFDLYDLHFFHGYFRRQFQGQLLFSLSMRMNRNAGMTIYPPNLQSLTPEEERYELRIAVFLLFSYEKLQREKIVNGIKTRDSLQALQLIFEHELCHIIELHCFKESSCRKERFQTLAFNIFGHTGSCHQLPLMPEIAAAEYGLSVGDEVSFQVDGRTFNGVIFRITRRATVMVPDARGTFQDRIGGRYHKFYVPLSLLKKRKHTLSTK